MSRQVLQDGGAEVTSSSNKEKTQEVGIRVQLCSKIQGHPWHIWAAQGKPLVGSHVFLPHEYALHVSFTKLVVVLGVLKCHLIWSDMLTSLVDSVTGYYTI